MKGCDAFLSEGPPAVFPLLWHLPPDDFVSFFLVNKRFAAFYHRYRAEIWKIRVQRDFAHEHDAQVVDAPNTDMRQYYAQLCHRGTIFQISTYFGRDYYDRLLAMSDSAIPFERIPDGNWSMLDIHAWVGNFMVHGQPRPYWFMEDEYGLDDPDGVFQTNEDDANTLLGWDACGHLHLLRVKGPRPPAGSILKLQLGECIKIPARGSFTLSESALTKPEYLTQLRDAGVPVPPCYKPWFDALTN